MVAKITTPQNVRRALNYNEQKVKQEKAKCIYAANYLKDADKMNFQDKLERFQQHIELNQRAKTNSLHISLNFYPSDKINSDKMIAIANIYMQKIGFGNQPYLVYQHFDAGHPHCHIVTTNIKENGTRIDTYNIGKKRSEPARKLIEQEFGLTKAEGRQPKKLLSDKFAQKAVYGKSETKRAIANVLDAVLDKYKYGSLAELNAVLRLYHVEADPGKLGSRLQQKQGLHYRIIDDQGNKIGVPIKASAIYSKPTLTRLNEMFAKNVGAKSLAAQKQLQTRIDWVLSKNPTNLHDFVRQLSTENVDVVVRQSEHAKIYGLTYIDHNTCTIYNGSEIGTRYAAKGLQQLLERNSETTSDKFFEPTTLQQSSSYPELEPPKAKSGMSENEREYYLDDQRSTRGSGKTAFFTLIDNVLSVEQDDSVAPELTQEPNRRKKRKDFDQEFER